MSRFGLVIVLACACSDSGTEPADANRVDAPRLPIDAASVDASAFDPGPEPTTVIRPISGEVTIIQLFLPGTIKIGEAAIIVGPSGDIVLLDVGNDSHQDEVREAVRELNTLHLTPANGFPSRSPLQVEWVIITHLHADHVGAFHDLFVDPTEPLEIKRGIVHRGLVDIGDGVNEERYEQLCAGLAGALSLRDVPLCTGTATPSCTYAQVSDPNVALNCDGLQKGDLSSASDDAAGNASYIDLDDGARITFIAVNGYASAGAKPIAIASFGHDTGDEENARSVVGILAHGGFRYHFGGDLHGRSSDGPDVESHVVDIAGPSYYGTLGVDVIHADHHARATSSNANFVAATAPTDGRSRNVVAGINPAYLGSPFASVLDRWGDNDRLGGGLIWATATTFGGGSSPVLLDADGPVIVQTIQKGLGYRVQAAGATLFSKPFPSVRR